MAVAYALQKLAARGKNKNQIVTAQRPRSIPWPVSHSSRRRSGSLSRQPEPERFSLLLLRCRRQRAGLCRGHRGRRLREAALRLQQETFGRGETGGDGEQLVTKRTGTLAPLKFTLRGVDSTHAYLAVRSIQRRTAEEFGIGFYAGLGIFSGRLVIPIHNQRGELVAYCSRAVDGSAPRQRFPPRFAKSEILFDCHRAAAAEKHAVVVVEGFFDCFQLHQAGIRSVVALMGSALYEPQQRLLLERFRRVILLLDGDVAGQRATAEIATRLRPHCCFQAITLPTDMQPDQLSRDQVWDILRACRDPGPALGSNSIAEVRLSS